MPKIIGNLSFHTLSIFLLKRVIWREFSLVRACFVVPNTVLFARRLLKHFTLDQNFTTLISWRSVIKLVVQQIRNKSKQVEFGP